MQIVRVQLQFIDVSVAIRDGILDLETLQLPKFSQLLGPLSIVWVFGIFFLTKHVANFC